MCLCNQLRKLVAAVLPVKKLVWSSGTAAAFTPAQTTTPNGGNTLKLDSMT